MNELQIDEYILALLGGHVFDLSPNELIVRHRKMSRVTIQLCILYIGHFIEKVATNFLHILKN